MRIFYIVIALFLVLAWDLSRNDGALFRALNTHADQMMRSLGMAVGSGFIG